jgi:hypothetical protein
MAAAAAISASSWSVEPRLSRPTGVATFVEAISKLVNCLQKRVNVSHVREGVDLVTVIGSFLLPVMV